MRLCGAIKEYELTQRWATCERLGQCAVLWPCCLGGAGQQIVPEPVNNRWCVGDPLAGHEMLPAWQHWWLGSRDVNSTAWGRANAKCNLPAPSLRPKRAEQQQPPAASSSSGGRAAALPAAPKSASFSLLSAAPAPRFERGGTQLSSFFPWWCGAPAPCVTYLIAANWIGGKGFRQPTGGEN